MPVWKADKPRAEGTVGAGTGDLTAKTGSGHLSLCRPATGRAPV